MMRSVPTVGLPGTWLSAGPRAIGVSMEAGQWVAVSLSTECGGDRQVAGEPSTVPIAYERRVMGTNAFACRFYPTICTCPF
jgi:hypothetical protein